MQENCLLVLFSSFGTSQRTVRSLLTLQGHASGYCPAIACSLGRFIVQLEGADVLEHIVLDRSLPCEGEQGLALDSRQSGVEASTVIPARVFDVTEPKHFWNFITT